MRGIFMRKRDKRKANEIDWTDIIQYNNKVNEWPRPQLVPDSVDIPRYQDIA